MKKEQNARSEQNAKRTEVLQLPAGEKGRSPFSAGMNRKCPPES